MRSIGIIKCGRAAQVRRIPEYADHRDARLNAFYGLNPKRARELADTYGSRAYETYEELLRGEEIDAVSIYVPNEPHAEIFIVTLKARKDVICEKPMTVTSEECRQMAEVAEKTGQCLMVGQNQRLAKGYTLARKLTEYGDIEKVITLKTTFGHGRSESQSVDPGSNTWLFDKRKTATGATIDLGIHKADLIQYLMGRYVAETTTAITTLDKKDGSGSLIGADDSAICIYKMESGAVGTMTASWTHYGQEGNSIILYESEGVVRIYEDSEYYVKTIKPDNETILYNVDQIQTNDKQARSGVVNTFMDYIVRGKETQLSGENVLNAMEVAFASIESTKTGKTTKIG